MNDQPIADEVTFIDTLMRDTSIEADPQQAARIYGAGVRQMYPFDSWLALSRRGLAAPTYRITRSTRWTDDVNPWKQPERLPRLEGGILGELLYGGSPRIIQNFTCPPDDPAYEYLAEARTIFAIPQYENGTVLNMPVVIWNTERQLDTKLVMMMLWQSNLFGRATLNMVLRQQLSDAYTALDRELSIVGEIQRSLLPVEMPDIPGVQLAASYVTAQRAGGDYYDFFPLPAGRWGIFIADVSGHGTPAAVMMAVTHAVAHFHAGRHEPPSRMLCYLNRALFSHYTRGNGTFVTACHAIYDPVGHTLTYASAGHNPARLLREGTVTAATQPTGVPLGIDDDQSFGDEQLQLRPGDTLLAYTDGITETFAESGAMYGVERLDACLQSAGPAPQQCIDAVTADVARFCNCRAPQDDQTLVALHLAP